MLNKYYFFQLVTLAVSIFFAAWQWYKNKCFCVFFLEILKNVLRKRALYKLKKKTFDTLTVLL